MNPYRGASSTFFLFALLLPRIAAATPGEDASPAARYQALLKEYQAASLEFRRAGTDGERKTAVEHLQVYSPKFVELAEREEQGSIALDLLVEAVRALNAADSLTQTTWEMNTASFPAADHGDAAARAVALLRRAYLGSDRLGLVCERMTYGVRGEFEAFLREVLTANRHREVQGLACLALARFLHSRANQMLLLEERPELFERTQDLLGRDYFARLRKRGRQEILREVEALFERALTDYREVKLPFSGTVGEVASEELDGLRTLAVGKAAPEIAGVDQNDRPMKLSEFRGQVVLLDFWSEY